MCSAGSKTVNCLTSSPQKRGSSGCAQSLQTHPNDALRSGTIFYKAQGALRLHIFHDPQELRENHEKQMLQLVAHRIPTLYSSLPGLAESAQFRCGALGNDQRQGMPKRDDVSYYFGSFSSVLFGELPVILSTAWYASGLFEQALFLSFQKVKYGLRVRSRRFKTDHDFFQIMAFLELNESGPEHLKSVLQIVECKRPYVLAVWRPEIAIVYLLADIDRGDQRILVEFSELLWFILSHGCAPPLICVNQLAIGSNQSEYSRFPFNSTAYWNIASFAWETFRERERESGDIVSKRKAIQTDGEIRVFRFSSSPITHHGSTYFRPRIVVRAGFRPETLDPCSLLPVHRPGHIFLLLTRVTTLVLIRVMTRMLIL